MMNRWLEKTVFFTSLGFDFFSSLVVIFSLITILGCEGGVFNLSSSLTDVDTELYIEHKFAVTGATVLRLSIETSDNRSWGVDWGDQATDTELYSSENFSGLHIYSTPYTGDVTIIIRKNTFIKKWVSDTGTWSFDLQDLPRDLKKFDISGTNNITGDILDLPSGLEFYSISGSNTTSGNIANLPSSLVYYYSAGTNTTTGNIGDLPRNLTYYRNAGSNTTSGNISNLPSNLQYYNNQGNNITTGNISSLPVSLVFYLNIGSNTTSGDIASLPPNLNYFLCSGGMNTITATTVFWNSASEGFRRFYLRGVGVNSTAVNNILGALAKINSWLDEKTVDIAGNNSAPTAAGINSKNLILMSGATTVNVN